MVKEGESRGGRVETSPSDGFGVQGRFGGKAPLGILPLGGINKSLLSLQLMKKLIDRLFSLDKLVCGGATTIPERLDPDTAI